MKISELQRHLEKIYRLENQPSVENYILELGKSFRPQLLIQKDPEGYSLGVHIGEEVLKEIEENGFKKISLQKFCSAAEEISHFTYLFWTISNHRPVSLLDIELQGEIDKFLLASEYFKEDPTLFEHLFAQFSFEEELSQDEKRRYEEANRLGGKYCLALLAGVKTVQDLRQFYRLNSSARLSHVEKMK